MIEYHVKLLSISQQTLKVTMKVSQPSKQLKLQLPAWIPGSYMIRDFARNLGEFQATDSDGSTLHWQKLDKQTWLVDTNEKLAKITYTIVANDFSVRGAYINDEYAFMNGTSVFLEAPELSSVQHTVCLEQTSAPNIWSIYTALTQNEQKEVLRANDYSQLIDSPIYWGIADVTEFSVDGVEFSLLLSGNKHFDSQRIAEDLKPICEHHLTLFGKPHPINRYLFITLLTDKGYGGLEHRESTVLMFPRLDLPLTNEAYEDNEGYIDFLSLCSHEFFHTWHVKRLRPQILLAPDLSSETYTEQLWIYEGITSFYDDLTVARAGKMSPERYVKVLNKHLKRLYQTPGRHKQNVAESSFDAWTRFYKQDASSANHIVSYYTKGGIIAMGLDIVLRQRSNGSLTLDNMMQWLWEHHGRNETGTADDIIQTACLSLGVDVNDYLNDVTYDVKDVELDILLPFIGLGLTETKTKGPDLMGVQLNKHSLGCKVSKVLEDGMACQAGIQVGDVIISVNRWLASEELLERVIRQCPTDQSIYLEVARQGRVVSLSMKPNNEYSGLPEINIADEDKFYAWLGIDPNTFT